MASNAVPRLTIAGLEVPLDMYGDHAFRRPLGVHAPEMVWCLPPYIAEAVLKLSETEITMARAGQTTPKTFKRVKVVCERPSDHPKRRYVLLSDARWPLPRVYVKENYNLRTTSSETELLKVDGEPNEIDPVANLVTYASNSLKGGAPWTADQILEDILTRRLGVKFQRLARSLGNYAPNDVQIDGPGNIALAQALAAAGGLDIRINDEGDVELVDAFLGAEKAEIEKWIKYDLLTKGRMRWISETNVAPTKVQVGFDAEIEVRADGWLRAPGVTADPKADGSWPTLRNVIRVTDRELATTDPVTGKSYKAVIGSYLPEYQWFPAVASDTVVPAPSPIPTQVSWSREYACFDYFSNLLEHWFVTGNTGGLEASSAWSNRFGALKTDFLKTWQLNPFFARLALPGSIRPVRAQLLDAATQSRQPSAAFLDYCRRPSTRGVRDNKNFGWNVHGVAGSTDKQLVGPTKTYNDPSWPDNLVPLADCKQAPIDVGLRDPISGIFRFAFKKDIHDHTAEQAPALVQQLPTNDLDQVNRGAAPGYWEEAKLVTTQRVILVFTAVPAAAPLYFVDVSPETALARLGVQSTTTPKGPAFQTRTGPALQTARFTYADSIRKTIQAIFDAQSSAAAAGLLQSLDPENLAILKDYAASVAAVLYAALLDHYEGEQEIEFTPDAMPVGSLQSVVHTMYADGRIYTRFEAKHVIPAAQPIHFMERGARAVVFRNPGNFR